MIFTATSMPPHLPRYTRPNDPAAINSPTDTCGKHATAAGLQSALVGVPDTLLAWVAGSHTHAYPSGQQEDAVVRAQGMHVCTATSRQQEARTNLDRRVHSTQCRSGCCAVQPPALPVGARVVGWLALQAAGGSTTAAAHNPAWAASTCQRISIGCLLSSRVMRMLICVMLSARGPAVGSPRLAAWRCPAAAWHTCCSAALPPSLSRQR